jgi:hypothetical protein
MAGRERQGVVYYWLVNEILQPNLKDLYLVVSYLND